MDIENSIEEWEIYHNFKPSIFQKIVWIFWPTITYIKWKQYRYIERISICT